ncbi:MAG: DNA primase [Candidatus Peregrinibacteria bacterium]|nr:DNA primase [Candidatus Peregrinibacteria bacterium]
MNHLDEIRAKLSIEEVVSGHVQLKKAGRNLKGLCPFHNDSRPSFMVSPEKGIGYCFSCNTGGDIFKFIQLVEKVDFPEAVKILADRAGVRLPEFKPEAHDAKLRMLKSNMQAADFYVSRLKSSSEGMNYFRERGLSEATMGVFKLGYAPDSYHSLKDELTKEGFKEKDLLEVGLLNQRSIADQSTYDRFRNRYIFPIQDHQGNVVGFGGRIIGEGEPKYLNSPDTPVYNKSFVLYGLHLAKEAIKQKDLVIFVEGYMDVIAAHQAGTQNVVATSGTALTAGQLKLIKRYTRNVAFAFDSDAAGMEATRRAIELAQEAELNIKIIRIPNGKDPDECIKESPDAWLKAIERRVPAMDFYFDHAFTLNDKKTMEGKKAILEILLPLIGQYPTAIEQSEYMQRLAYELGVDVKFLWDDMKKMKARSRVTPSAEADVPAPEKRQFSREEFLLGFIFSSPELYPLAHSSLILSAGFDPGTEKIYKTLKKGYDSQSVIQSDEIKALLEENDRQKIDVLTLLIDEYYPDFSPEAAEKEVVNLVRAINQQNLKRSQKEFELRIRNSKDPGERTLLLNEYSQILKLSSKL